jgi:hypothetical protein
VGERKVRDGHEQDDLQARTHPPIVEDEFASTENQLERSWIRALSLVSDSQNGAMEGFKPSDVAVQPQSNRKDLAVLVATFVTASALCIWAAGSRPFSNLPRQAEMPHSLASIGTKEAAVGTEAQNIQTDLGRSETTSQPPVLSAELCGRLGDEIDQAAW